MGTETKEIAVTNQEQHIALIERLATNPDVDVDKLQKIMDMQEQANDKAAQQAFNAAMVQAQKNMPVVIADKYNDQTKSKYPSYKALLRATQPVYTAEGFSVSFYEEDIAGDDLVRICADIMHEVGHTIKRHVDIPLDNQGIKGSINKTGTHAKGSSISYGRSYLMKMIFNIPTGDDDDGNAAGSQLITEEQENKLLAMIDENGLDTGNYKANLFKYLKVSSLDLLPAIKFNMAKIAINTAIKSQQKED